MEDCVHEYTAKLTWEGNTGEGTASYTSYSRRHRIGVAGKPDLEGTADVAFRGDRDRHNPEDLFVSAIAACHMLSYLAACARRGVRVIAYEDEATGVMHTNASGGGAFERVTLHPRVTVADGADVDLAMALHDTAHELCFIANSCSVRIDHEAQVVIA